MQTNRKFAVRPSNLFHARLLLMISVLVPWPDQTFGAGPVCSRWVSGYPQNDYEYYGVSKEGVCQQIFDAFCRVKGENCRWDTRPASQPAQGKCTQWDEHGGCIDAKCSIEYLEGGRWRYWYKTTAKPDCSSVPDLPLTSRNVGAMCGDLAQLNPIHAAYGNKYQIERVFESKNVSGMAFRIYYNSETVLPSRLGSKWRHTYERSLLLSDPVSVVAYRQDGKALSFGYQNGNWYPEYDVVERLYNDGTHWNLVLADDTIESYDSSGRLVSISDRYAQTLTFSHDSEGRLVEVEDSSGANLTFIYDVSGRITTMTSPEGDLYLYSYGAHNNLVSVTYPDDTPDDLSDNPTRQYLYEDARFPHALTGIIDENGQRYASWTYDEQGRAITSIHAGEADSGTLIYNADGTTTVENALGKQTTYHYDVIHGVYKVIQVEGHPTASCAGANQAYTYDANGFLSSKTDWNGNVTTYVHDDRGLEISRTEGAGTPQARTIATEWHTDFRVPVRITEPGKVTGFSYDTNGRLLDKLERSIP